MLPPEAAPIDTVPKQYEQHTFAEQQLEELKPARHYLKGPPQSMWDPLVLGVDDLLAPAAEILGQALETTAPFTRELLRVHERLDLLHSQDELRRGFIQASARELVVQQAPHMGNDRLVQIHIAPLCYKPARGRRVASNPPTEPSLFQCTSENHV